MEVDVSQAPANGWLGGEPGRQGSRADGQIGGLAAVVDKAIEGIASTSGVCLVARSALPGLPSCRDGWPLGASFMTLWQFQFWTSRGRADEVQANLEVEDGKGPSRGSWSIAGCASASGRNEYGRYVGHAEGRDPFGSSDWGDPLPA